jgi:hypothetical protein
VSPKEFKARWQITNEELAVLLGYSLSGVKDWFRSQNPTTVPASVEATLDLINHQFLVRELLSRLPPDYEAVYLESVRRRSINRKPNN